MSLLVTADQVADGVLCLSLPATDEQIQMLTLYAQLLLKWNTTYNLTRICQPEDVVTLHLMDSLSLVKHLDELSECPIHTVLDVGSGGGLPAIPLAVMRPDLFVTMVDAVQKKVIFLRQAIAQLKIKNMTAVHSRIEELRQDPVDAITSRAFASLEKMTQLTEHLLKKEGAWIVMKGKMPLDELASLDKKIDLSKCINVDFLNGKINRNILALRKN